MLGMEQRPYRNDGTLQRKGYRIFKTISICKSPCLRPVACKTRKQARLRRSENLEFVGARTNLVNLFLPNLVRISGVSSLFLAIAVLSAHFAREC